MPKNNLMVRNANEEDIDTIFKIESESFPDPYPKGLLKSFLHIPSVYIVAISQGEIVGYSIGVLRYTDQGHVVSVAVAKSHQQEGIGRRLMQETIDGLGRMGAKSVRLEVRDSNSVAIDLYLKMGFVETEKIEGYYYDGERARVMYLNL